MNALQKALVSAGLAKKPKERQYRPRSFKCRACGSKTMARMYNTNVAVCDNCGKFILL